jgi:hypothetical protein
MIPLKIDGLWAWIATEDDGQEGVLGQATRIGWLPLIGADKDRIESYRDIAQGIAYLGTHVQLVQFTTRTDLETLTTTAKEHAS